MRVRPPTLCSRTARTPRCGHAPPTAGVAQGKHDNTSARGGGLREAYNVCVCAYGNARTSRAREDEEDDYRTEPTAERRDDCAASRCLRRRAYLRDIFYGNLAVGVGCRKQKTHTHEAEARRERVVLGKGVILKKANF